MLAFLRRQPPVLCLLESLLLVVLIGWSDLVTGYRASMVLFYSIPIVFAALCGQRSCPFAIAALAAVFWCWADFGSGHEYFSQLLHAWEISIRCVFFFAVAFAAVAINDRHEETRSRFEVLQRARKLQHQVTEITEHEQQRIGRELHDGLSQYLAAVSCAMSSLRMDTEKLGGSALTAKAGEIERLLSESVRQARDLARSLAPVHHNGPGLAAALNELAATTTRRLGVECTFESLGEEAINRNGVATYLYRIAQEAVDNAVQHGKAHEIVVKLSANHNAVNLSITDDGVGFSKSPKNLDGVGISVMEYRAGIIGGNLSIEEKPSGGTTVSCAILADGSNNAFERELS